MRDPKDNGVYPLFPTPVLQANKIYIPTKKELKFIHELERRPNTGSNYSSLNGYALESKELVKMKQAMQGMLNSYTHELLKRKDHTKFMITQSWFNYNPPGSFHYRHWHSNSLFSGTYYLTDNNSKIFFDKPQAITGGIEYEFKEINTMNCSDFGIEPLQYCALFFPSYLPHSVEPNQSKQERVSLSFNTFMRGSLGTDYRKTHLVI